MKKLLALLLSITCFVTGQAQRRDVTLPEKAPQKGFRSYINQDTGFWIALEAEGGSSIMQGKTNMQYANLCAIAGYRFNEYLRLGAGLGGRAYLNNVNLRESDDTFVMPVFVNVRGNIISAYDRDGVPYWSLNVGGITSEGFYFSPTLGYSFGGLRNMFLIGLSYTLSTFTDFMAKDRAYSYFGLKLGYEF